MSDLGLKVLNAVCIVAVSVLLLGVAIIVTVLLAELAGMFLDGLLSRFCRRAVHTRWTRFWDRVADKIHEWLSRPAW